jgi:hypothetical protein
MTDYVTVETVDFYNKLYDSLDVDDDYNNDENLCLITNQPLIKNFIKMECGHKFNYLPLFYDVKNHKLKFNGMEGTSSKLNFNQIRCPYCRKKQSGILPYYEDMELGKINGVNYINPNYKDKPTYLKYKYCEFITLNPDYKAEGINPIESSFYKSENCKFIKCTNTYALQINSGVINGENYGDDKYYCWTHRKQMIKKYKKEIVDKQKEHAKKEKLKDLEEKKKAKEEEKLKVKEEKLKVKEEKLKTKEEKLKTKDEKLKVKEETKTKTKSISKQNNIFNISGENLILAQNIVIETLDKNNLCIEILKSGIKKGLQCCSIKFKDNLCKRHFNLNSKTKKL